MRRGMRASGHAITSPPPPTTVQSLVPTPWSSHGHLRLVVDSIKLINLEHPHLTPVGFEPTPLARPAPKAGALDHSATVSGKKLDQ